MGKPLLLTVSWRNSNYLNFAKNYLRGSHYSYNFLSLELSSYKINILRKFLPKSRICVLFSIFVIRFFLWCFFINVDFQLRSVSSLFSESEWESETLKNFNFELLCFSMYGLKNSFSVLLTENHCSPFLGRIEQRNYIYYIYIYINTIYIYVKSSLLGHLFQNSTKQYILKKRGLFSTIIPLD